MVLLGPKYTMMSKFDHNTWQQRHFFRIAKTWRRVPANDGPTQRTTWASKPNSRYVGLELGNNYIQAEDGAD